MPNFAEKYFSTDLKPEGIVVSEDVRRFLCDELPESEAYNIVAGLDDLQRVVRDSFADLVSISLEMFENPEVPEERNICVRICLRNSEKGSFQQYQTYTRSFIKTFPFEFRQWFVTSIDYA